MVNKFSCRILEAPFTRSTSSKNSTLNLRDRFGFGMIRPRIEEDIQEGRMLEREFSKTEYKNKKKK